MTNDPQPDPDGMSQAQRAAIQRAYSELGEHFDAVLIAVDYETEDDIKDRADAHCCWWKGGWTTALGLASYCQHRLLNDRKEKEES